MQMTAAMTSGFGQFHTNEADPAKPKKKLTGYVRIDLDGIRLLVDTPMEVNKSQAQWLIPSTLPSRNFRTQEQEGKFVLLWADLDEAMHTLDMVQAALSGIIDDADFEIYTSASATEQRQKCRILTGLFKPLSGADWMLCQEVLNDKLEAAGITPDRASERTGQLCYLPNRGAFYGTRIQRDGVLLDPLTAWADEITAKRETLVQKAVEIEVVKKAAMARRAALRLSDTPDCIGAFNNAYSVAEILLLASYDQRGNTFRHPASESGSYSASVKNDRVHSLSSSDPLYTDGGGVGAHDAFSAFCILYADGDRSAALKLAGDEWLTVDGVRYNEARKRQPAGKAQNFNGDVDSLFNDVILRREDVQKMADAEFLLPNQLVRGHVLVNVSPANGGKTALWVHNSAVLCTMGLKVFYINVDGSPGDLKRHFEHASKHGYSLIAPDARSGKSTADVLDKIKSMASGSHACNDYVFIFDTLKKFVDVINKSHAKEFYKVLRSLTAKGVTVVLLAHTNKYKDADDKAIFEGTADLRNDVDELVYLDSAMNQQTGCLEITTRPDKIRAAFKPISFSIDVKNDRKVTELNAVIQIRPPAERELLDLILQAIREGHYNQGAIIHCVAEQSTHSDKKVRSLLVSHPNERDPEFTVKKTRVGKGLRYSLTKPVFADFEMI